MAEPAPGPQTKPLRVLYVEDDRVCALLFSEALRGQPGLSLQVAEDGAQALQLAGQWMPEVLVLDAHLPDTDGHALLNRLRCLPGLASAPAFMCSADSEAADVTRALASGFSGYWVKPVAADMLRALLLAQRTDPG